jgi:hypothetical protein
MIPVAPGAAVVTATPTREKRFAEERVTALLTVDPEVIAAYWVEAYGANAKNVGKFDAFSSDTTHESEMNGAIDGQLFVVLQDRPVICTAERGLVIFAGTRTE